MIAYYAFQAVLALWIVLIAGVPLILMNIGRDPAAGDAAPSEAEMQRHMVFGILYCNSEDPRGRVPRSSNPGDGMTLNFRHRSWAIAWWLVVVVGAPIMAIGAPLVSIWSKNHP